MDDDRQSDLRCEREVVFEEAPLRVAWGVVAKVVEPGLPHGDGSLVSQQLAQLVQPPGVGRIGVVWVDAENSDHAWLVLRELQGTSARRDARTDGDDPLDSSRPGAREHRCRWPVTRVEVRVSVDQAATRSTRGKSGGAGSMPLAGVTPPERTWSQPTLAL